MNTYIYILIDPITDLVRYIGKSNFPYKRFYNHCGYITKDYKGNWIKSLKNKGLKPVLYIIDEVPVKEWEFWEKFYISQFKTWGFKLTNSDEGGITNKQLNKESRLKISNSKLGKKRKPFYQPKWDKNRIENHKKSKKDFLLILHKFRTEESFKKIAEHKKGIKRSEECINKITLSKYKNSKLTKIKVNEIYNLAKNRIMKQKDIATLYEISSSDVSQILNKKRFKLWLEE